MSNIVQTRAAILRSLEATILAREGPAAMTWPDRDRWKRLSPLLDELLELEVQMRSKRLAELRASDAALAAELEDMLGAAGRVQAAHFLEDGVPGVGAAASTLVGQHVGAYVIDAPLGEGATGSVWRARRSDGRFEGRWRSSCCTCR